MKNSNRSSQYRHATAFVLPLVLILVGALVVIALAVVSLTGMGRGNAHAWVDHQRAELAARSGLEEALAVMTAETANDEYLVLQGQSPSMGPDGKRPLSHEFIARTEASGGVRKFRYVPLFSTTAGMPVSARLRWPSADECLQVSEDQLAAIFPYPWAGGVQAEWIPIPDEKGHVVSRYAYWVEDLQSRMDPLVVGNLLGAGGTHARSEFPFPAAGVNDPVSSTDGKLLNQVPMYPLRPDANEREQMDLEKRLITGRGIMMSPDASMAAAGIQPPLVRLTAPDAITGGSVGELVDVGARAIEENLCVGIQAYDEKAVVPYVSGIHASVVGMPKMNLNRLVSGGGPRAVGKMAKWIDQAMPEFSSRKGGFPDDYLKTLAAGAIDYADSDSNPTSDGASYRGVDATPFLSEVVLHIYFKKVKKDGDRWVLTWTFKLFAELWNLTDRTIQNGRARLSYEVDLRPTPLGASADSLPFDDPQILRDPRQSTHQLTEIQGKFYGPEVSVSLLPDQYQFYEFASVDYNLDYDPQLDAKGNPIAEEFDLEERASDARGVALIWNGQAVHTVPSIVRDPYGVSQFKTNQTRKTAKACIVGLNYGGYGETVNNMGDPRIAPYLRGLRLGENAYPENLSPNRRNIRRHNIYDADTTANKSRHYGRVMPSEWPDGGHDSPIGDFWVTTSDAVFPTQLDKWPLEEVPAPQPENAPQRISNAGKYFSITELGRIHDPIMWQPAYPDIDGASGSGAEDTEILLRLKPSRFAPAMPDRRHRWPEVTWASVPSPNYGGGNTLRLGRPEHPRFDGDGMRASELLDLFHVGVPESDDVVLREGPCVNIHGHININTASRDVLRCMAAGLLKQDPGLCRVTDWKHETTRLFGPTVEKMDLGAPSSTLVADRIADAIIRNRPYVSPSQIAQIKDVDGQAVFGNANIYPEAGNLQWSDAAAEEVFARVYDAATVRSRNFRIWVVGQRIEGASAQPKVLAESRKVFTVFCDPGKRNEDGSINPKNDSIHILHERGF